MHDLRLAIVNQVKDIPRQQWDELFPEDPIEGYAYYRALDESNLPLFSTRYAIVYKDEHISCIAPFFIANFSLDTTIQGYFKKIVSLLTGFIRIKTLFFGSPFTEKSAIGFSKDCDIKQVLNFLIQEALQFSKDKKISVVTFHNLNGRDTHIIDLLKDSGFGCMESLPLARLEIKERSLEEYIQNLGRSTRKNIRRKLKKAYTAPEIRIEERDNLNGVLGQAYQLYLNNYNRSGISFEKLTPEYFSKLSENMPGVAKFFIVWINNKMAAFNLCFVKGGSCIDKYVGFDYEVAYEYNLYYATWCHNIDWCIKHGVRYYQPGACDYNPKIRLGGTLIPLYACSRFINPVVNSLTAPILKLIKPGNFDPVLKNLHKYEKSNLTLKIIALIMFTDLLESIYEFFFKKGMLVVGEFDFSNLGAAGGFLTKVISNGWIWLGLAIIILETLMWLAILSKIDLSVAFPIGSLSYIFVLLVSGHLLHEQVSFNRWVGTAFIIAGIFLVAKSSTEKAVETIKI